MKYELSMNENMDYLRSFCILPGQSAACVISHLSYLKSAIQNCQSHSASAASSLSGPLSTSQREHAHTYHLITLLLETI